MLLDTKRLILRRFNSDDLDDLYQYLSNPLVVKYEPYKPMSLKEVEKELNERINSKEMIAVELKSNHKLIGNIYLGQRDYNTLELGYVFNSDYWLNGYAKEACQALINEAFSNGVHRIYAMCDPQNIASWKLLESLQFKREAHLKEDVYFFCDENNNPIWKDSFIYSKVKG